LRDRRLSIFHSIANQFLDEQLHGPACHQRAAIRFEDGGFLFLKADLRKTVREITGREMLAFPTDAVNDVDALLYPLRFVVGKGEDTGSVK
jgi:hypothetical protein